MSKTEKAVAWAEQIAADNRHGYGWGGWGPDYDCGHLIIQAYEQAGILVKSAGASYTGNMRGPFLRCGFTDVTASVNLATGGGLRRGDVLLNYVNHAALCVGSGRIVQARGNLDGLPGDSSGQEIRVQPYYNYPWDCVLRPPVSETAVQPSTSVKPSTSAQSGSYTVKAGDTLYTIAAANGLRWTDLAVWNNIRPPYIIHPGQTLTMSKPGGAAAQTQQKPENAAPVQQGVHTVLAGDTLWSIAARTMGSGAKWQKLADANGLKFPWIIRPGQVLVIPKE